MTVRRHIPPPTSYPAAGDCPCIACFASLSLINKPDAKLSISYVSRSQTDTVPRQHHDHKSRTRLFPTLCSFSRSRTPSDPPVLMPLVWPGSLASDVLSSQAEMLTSMRRKAAVEDEARLRGRRWQLNV